MQVIRGADGRFYPFSGQAYQGAHSLGEAPGVPIADTLAKMFTIIPAFYTVSIDLASDDGSTASNSVPLRPEPFVCTRITWATVGDAVKYVGLAQCSQQGRVVEVSWEDEFTKFLGNRPCLISALFGDSNGFLDIPKGVLFEGKQTIAVSLRRITWPASSGAATVRFDFNFQGLALLPKGVSQSGSAG